MRRPHATADGWLVVLPYTTAQWHRFFHLIGRAHLAAEADLADPAKRDRRLEELYALFDAAMPFRKMSDWVAALLSADMLFGEVFSPEQLLNGRAEG
jgi:crotonobetainyl-CoA:carnitine CoA-transferase CaiB-like acyl-CoA transferase